VFLGAYVLAALIPDWRENEHTAPPDCICAQNLGTAVARTPADLDQGVLGNVEVGGITMGIGSKAVVDVYKRNR
jgi:hypothetical protein